MVSLMCGSITPRLTSVVLAKLAEACVWLSKDPVWSCSSRGRHCLRAEPVSFKVPGSVRGPYPHLAPCGPRGNIYLLKACRSLGIFVPLPTKKRKGESGFGLLLYRKQSVLVIWHFDELQWHWSLFKAHYWGDNSVSCRLATRSSLLPHSLLLRYCVSQVLDTVAIRRSKCGLYAVSKFWIKVSAVLEGAGAPEYTMFDRHIKTRIFLH